MTTITIYDMMYTIRKGVTNVRRFESLSDYEVEALRKIVYDSRHNVRGVAYNKKFKELYEVLLESITCELKIRDRRLGKVRSYF